MFTTTWVLAQDGAAAVPVDPSAPAWLQGLVAILTVLLTAFALPWMKARAAAARDEAAAHRANASSGELSAKELLVDMVKAYLYDAAAVIVEAEFPRIAQAVLNGALKDKTKVKVILKELGTQLRGQAVRHFDDQGINLLAALGDQYLDELIRSAADKVSPFPGRDTAVSFLTEVLSNKLIDKGTDYVREWIEGENEAARETGTGDGTVSEIVAANPATE
jgi:hypothetical protein